MGGRFCSLHQTQSECESFLVEIMLFRPRNRVKTEEKASLQFGTKFGRNVWDLFVLTGLFRLINQRSYFDGRTLNLYGGR